MSSRRFAALARQRLATPSRMLLAVSLATAATFGFSTAQAQTIIGAGSSAAAPVYRIWGSEYAKEKGSALTYEPVGSGAGMAPPLRTPFALLESKLAPPRLREGTISRPELAARLRPKPPANLSLVVAPAGYGKTTLAREWAAERPHLWYRGTPATGAVAP